MQGRQPSLALLAGMVQPGRCTGQLAAAQRRFACGSNSSWWHMLQLGSQHNVRTCRRCSGRHVVVSDNLGTGQLQALGSAVVTAAPPYAHAQASPQQDVQAMCNTAHVNGICTQRGSAAHCARMAMSTAANTTGDFNDAPSATLIVAEKKDDVDIPRKPRQRLARMASMCSVC